MKQFEKPVVVVSKCLGFAKCRYNGLTIPDSTVNSLKDYVSFLKVCPEVEIGLGVPRDPIRIVYHNEKKYLYQPATGKDITNKMESFTRKYLDSLDEVDGFILKYKSPSCGPKNVKVYKGFENKVSHFKDSGFFADQVLKKHSGLAIEDEGRLRNFTIRENFLIKLFTLADFRKVKKNNLINSLINFHTRNKYLFLAYNQTLMRKLGKIVANHKKHSIKKVLTNYESTLYELFKTKPKFSSWINVLQHAFGGISKNLSSSEKTFFLNTVEEYRDERIPLSVLIKLIYSWALRFKEDYLLNQTFINPFPRELIEVKDSGKGR